MEKESFQCMDCQTDKDLIQPYHDQTYICKSCYEKQTEANLKMNSFKNAQCDFIIDGIFLGNQDASRSLKILQINQISAVCACGFDLKKSFQQRFSYQKFSIEDKSTQQISHLFDQNYEWIKQQLKSGKNVLIHCSVGMSRSPSFVIAYIMRQYKMTYQNAFNYVKQKRSIIKPNPGFVKQLKQFEEKLKEQRRMKQETNQQQK